MLGYTVQMLLFSTDGFIPPTPSNVASCGSQLNLSPELSSVKKDCLNQLYTQWTDHTQCLANERAGKSNPLASIQDISEGPSQLQGTLWHWLRSSVVN